MIAQVLIECERTSDGRRRDRRRRRCPVRHERKDPCRVAHLGGIAAAARGQARGRNKQKAPCATSEVSLSGIICCSACPPRLHPSSPVEFPWPRLIAIAAQLSVPARDSLRDRVDHGLRNDERREACATPVIPAQS
jgi:hypothetical protein